jgi:hypothetical protein
MTQTCPPDDRLDADIHGWFGLSYSNYLVLPRTLMQSMPADWQRRMVTCLEDLDDAYRHIKRAECYEVTAVRQVEYRYLTDAEMKQLDVAAQEPPEGVDPATFEPGEFYDRDGHAHYPGEMALVPLPGGDPVPSYDRGRTYIEPRLSEPAQ